MRARARARFDRGPHGATRAVVLRSEAPLLVRWTDPVLHLVGGAAGPLGGDDLRVEVGLGCDTRVAVRSAAASVVLPGRGPSQLAVEVTVGRGAVLDWRTEPLVSTARSHHRTEAVVRLERGAALRWQDDVVLGRHAERPGRLATSLRVEVDGLPLVHHELHTGIDAQGWDGPAVVGDHRVVCSLVIVDPAWAASGPPGPATATGDRLRAAALPLEGPAVLVMGVGDGLEPVAAALDDLVRDLGVTVG